MDDLLEELAAQGWLVSTLYQRDDGEWVCNLRHRVEGGDLITDWAFGPTAKLALETAMVKMADAEFLAEAEQSVSADTTSTPVSRGLLSRLGLASRLEPIRRI